ncbi:coiled-coil domain-containing protein [Kribbella jiaozuonensis]|uniref:Chromosome segregation ATPase n=1 Tax=Kribbella jiaozuonensis TaxID=2575441 RepID=A0A4U3LR96_9ACTN|nr:chromosome segregation ATPase [Kribbella jiaozuonensis]TKK76947.1 chromosome segregation ATPase [Kribbella jiaozuonensis]
MSAATEDGPFDILGSKVLLGVQVVDLSRLSTHPIPMIGRGLITVAGQGPTDSNGAGKSSWIAALSLLHADDQWRLTSGAPGAAELLFTAEAAGQEGNWSNVDRGYIVGVFSDPGLTDLDEVEAAAITVWIRINRKASYIDLRWKQGLHIPYGATEAERAAGADALWAALPHSNGRTDFHANKLSQVLYGGQVRCVSFLSTSVRSSPTANLLAEPLNELGPARIFNAIATLTGLDHELEQEQAHRSAEHTQREATKQATADLQRWEQEMATVEAGILQRAAAREALSAAKESWQARNARHLIDGDARNREILQELGVLDERVAEQEARKEAVDSEIDAFGNEEGMLRDVQLTRQERDKLDARDRELDLAQRSVREQLERLGQEHRRLVEAGRSADGRDLAAAAEEQAEAREVLEEHIGRDHAARVAVEHTEAELREAESGQTVSATQQQVLETAGIDCGALTDITELPESDRAEWEPRLAPYREAVVIDAGDATVATTALADAGYPGFLLVLANRPDAPKLRRGPKSADERFTLDGFFAALGERATKENIDEAAGVVAVGQFDEPITGRTARIQAAGRRVEAAKAARAVASAALDQARSRVEQAERRTAAAQALADADAVQEQILQLRETIDRHETDRDSLAPQLQAAKESAETAAGQQLVRDERLKNLESTRRDHDRILDDLTGRRLALLEEQTALDLTTRTTAWGGTPAEAEEFILSLPDDAQRRTTADWNHQACTQLDDVIRRCFPNARSREEIPTELWEILNGPDGWTSGTLGDRVGLVPALHRTLSSHLAQHETFDSLQQQQIASQRAERNAALERAREGLDEAESTARAHRTSLADGIKARLRLVSQEFDRLDQQYGGYGAKLEFPEPDPPAEPDKPWRWTVTPKWRRSEGGPFSAFNVKGNTAQMDEKAVKLVCAAALAGGSDRPLLLILDELGRNLGSQHRREAVALFEQIGRDRNITVIGALQDDMERYALASSRLYVKLRRSSDTMAYNQAPVVKGNEDNAARVELLREWMTSYRGSTPTLELASPTLT